MLKFKFLNFKFPRVIPTPAQPPDKKSKLWLVIIASIALAAHFFFGDIVICLFALSILIIKARIIQLNKNNPPRWATWLLLGSCIALIFIQYGGWNGYKAGISFLIALLALKLLEASNLRDYFVVCLLMYFLAATSFLFSTSPLAIVAVVIFSIGVTSAMSLLTSPDSFNPLNSIKHSSWMMLKAIPLAVFLFFFFPRIQADFGFLPGQDEELSEGISNELSAGDLANRSFNNDLAFRVEFVNQRPPNSSLYWRNKTMSNEQDFRWITDKRQATKFRAGTNIHLSRPNLYEYEVLQEANKDKFLTVLDYIAHSEKGLILDNYSVLKYKNMKGAFSYTAWASTEAIQDVNHLSNRNSYLRTDTTPGSRAKKLINRWKLQTQDKQEQINLVLNYFKNQPFKYSLLPPKLGKRQPVDEFLFETQTGYCEHYASVFTLIMRWMDIPSRIVVGFQGGEWNEQGQYYAIRYSDAHAWSEVWLKGQGWTRVDPTAMISPERIEFGMDALMALWDENRLQTNITGQALSDWLEPKGISKTMYYFQQIFGNASYQWNKWIVNYNLDTQKALLQSIGLDKKHYLRNLIIIMLLGSVLLIAFYMWRLLPKKQKVDEIEKLYQQFCTIMAKYGLQKGLAEGATTFAARATKHFPQSAADIQRITQYYIAQRYGKSTQETNTYKNLINEFKRNSRQHNYQQPSTTA